MLMRPRRDVPAQACTLSHQSFVGPIRGVGQLSGLVGLGGPMKRSQRMKSVCIAKPPQGHLPPPATRLIPADTYLTHSPKTVCALVLAVVAPCVRCSPHEEVVDWLRQSRLAWTRSVKNLR